MNKTWSICCALILTTFVTSPVLAKSANPPKTTNQKINELDNRVTSLEATWGRLQVGGNLSLESNSFFEDESDTSPKFGFEQDLRLYLDAFIEDHLMFSLKLAHEGGWGINYQNLGASSYPMTMPLEVDEAFVRLEYPDNLNYLGRFRFSMSPVGLIADFYNNPVEGVTVQKSFGQFHAIGVYSRVNTEYESGTDLVNASEDYFAARMGWSDTTKVFGVNLVPNGITGEKSVSLDASFIKSDAKLSTELAWYSFKTDQYPDYEVDWTPGFLISYGQPLSKKTFFQIKAAYLGDQFMPAYSSLAHSSGDSREWFLPNSKGIELLIQNQLRSDIRWENRIIALSPVVNHDQEDLTYRWRSGLMKYFSPVNRIELGLDINHTGESDINQVYLAWNLNF